MSTRSMERIAHGRITLGLLTAAITALVLLAGCRGSEPTLVPPTIAPTTTPISPTATVTANPTPQPAGDGVVHGWAVLAEKDYYADVGKTDLVVDYISITRLHQLLSRLGWQQDHIHELREFDRQDLRGALDWLAENADADDVILLYVAAHGSYLREDLGWSSFFAADWAALPCGQCVLIVDACTAAEFTAAVKDDSRPHLSIAAVDADEYGWSGLEEEGLPIIGNVFTYYFAAAFDEPDADTDGDGLVSVQEAALMAEEQQRIYFHQVVLAVPEFVEMYHDIGAFPEKDPDYPHVVVHDAIGAPLHLVLNARDLAGEAQKDAPLEFKGRVDVGGYEMYLHCTGAGTPTVILLGDMPLVVLTSPGKERAGDIPPGLSAKFDKIWVELQKEWTQISSRSTHIMADRSRHFIQHDQPDLVLDAILQVVEDARH